MEAYRETLHRRLRMLRMAAEAARRSRGEDASQRALEKEVRRTGLQGTETFQGKVTSRWAPQDLRDFHAPRPSSSDEVLAVIAVWESWKGIQTLGIDGRVRTMWLQSDACRDWQQLLEDAHQETQDARRRGRGSSGAEGEVDVAVARYQERLVQSHLWLNLDVLGSERHAGEQPAIGLRDVFEPPLVVWDPPRPELPAPLWRHLIEGGDLTENDLPPEVDPADIEQWRQHRAERPPQPVLEAVASDAGRRLVVLGDPGAGKSTLAKYLALALAGGLETVPGELAGLAGAVPVVIELRHLAAERWQGRTIEDFWDELNATERMFLPRNILEGLLRSSQHPLVVIFDGLDEIFDSTRRTEVARQIAAFAQAHPHARIVVTSRVIGFAPSVFTHAGFHQSKLEDLTRPQTESFIRRWYAASNPTDPNEATRLAERLTMAVRRYPSVAALTGNPLLLTILAAIGLGAAIPRDRREVYRHAVEVLTGRWDRDAKNLQLPRKAHPDVATAIDELDAGLLQELLERIARRLQEGAAEGGSGTLISRRDLIGMIADFLVELNYAPHVGRVVADAMVERLHQRAFLLHPHGAGMYGFVHRTFLEYLAARDLGQRYNAREWTPDQLVDMLAERARDPSWHEVILLLLGHISRQAEAQHAALIARLLDMHNRRRIRIESPSDEDTRYLQLAIRALAEAHRIGRAQPFRGVDQRFTLADQSDAVVDTLIDHLEGALHQGLDSALPAFASFPRTWSGRERFLRWYRATRFQSRPSELSGKVAAWMCLDAEEADRLLHPWSTQSFGVLEVMTERWPDHDDNMTAVLGLARDTNVDPWLRSKAMERLGLMWWNREEIWSTVLNASRPTGDPPYIRRVALRILGQHWPEREDSHIAVLDAARDATASKTRSDAVTLLGQYWPEREDSHIAVLDASRDATTSDEVRRAAVETLGKSWPDSDDSRAAVLTVALDISAPKSVRVSAVWTLGSWPGHDDSRAAVLAIAREPTAPHPVRSAAVSVLARYWPHCEDSRIALLDVVRDPKADDSARFEAVRFLAKRWSHREDSRTAILDAARTVDTDGIASAAALKALATQWPNHHESWSTILYFANATASRNARGAQRAAVRMLAQQWPDREESFTLVLNAARDETAGPWNAREEAVRALGQCWPESEDSHAAVLDAARDPMATLRVRSAAIDVLRECWPDRDDSRAAVLGVAHDGNAPVRSSAMAALGERWPDHAGSRAAVLDVVRDTSAPEEVRRRALVVATWSWPHSEDGRLSVLDVARDANAPEDLRIRAVEALGNWWSDHEGCRTTVLDIVRDTNAPESVRCAALQVLGERWSDKEARSCVARATEPDEPEKLREQANLILALLWPSEPTL